MSKNLRGLSSGSSVTINLLDIDANSVTATTGTFTDIIATNYSINNVAINNLIVSGVVRLTGIVDAPVTLLPEYEILFKDPYNNLVYKFSTLVFNTNSGTLKSPDILAATMTVGDITVNGNITLVGSIDSLRIQALASVASNSVHPLVLWNSTTKNISQDNTKLYYDTSTDTLYSPNISVTNLNVVPVTRSNNVAYPIVFYDYSTSNLAVDTVAANISYNPSDNRLSLVKCRVTQDLQVSGDVFLSGSLYMNSLGVAQPNVTYSIMLWDSTNTVFNRAAMADTSKLYYDTSTDTLYSPNISVTNFNIVPVTRSDNVDYKVVFFDDTTDNLAVDSGSTAFTFNPSDNKLKTVHVDILYDLTAGRDTFLGGRLHVNNINPVQSGATYGEQYPLIVWHINATNGSKDVAQDFQNLYYDTTTNTLHAPNISGNLDIVATIKNDSIEYPVSFHDTTLNKLCIDGNLKFKYNPDENRLTVKNALINDAFEVVGQTTLTDVTMTGNFICDGTAVFGDDCTITSSKNLKFVEADVTVTGDKGIIYSQDIGRVIFRRSSSLDPVVQLVNEVARTNGISGLYQIQLSAVDVDFNTVSTGSIRNRVDGNIRTTLTNTDFTVSTDMEITGDTTITVFNALATPVNTNCRLLFLEGTTLTGRVSGNGCYYNPLGDVMFSNRLQGSVHSRSPLFLISPTAGTGNGSIQQATHSDTQVYLRYDQANGHLFRIGSSSGLLITNGLSTIYTPFRCDGDCTIEYKPALASEARDMRVVVSDVDATDKTIKQHNQFTFNPSTTLLSVPNIDATGTVTAGTLDVTNNMTVSGTFTCGDIDFGSLESTNAAAKITVQQPIQYGGGIFVQPLNYTIKIGTTDLIRTIDTASGTGFNSGKFGNGVTLSILRSGVKTTSYGQDTTLIAWNPYIDATNTATNFTLGGLPGLWDIKMTCKYFATLAGSSNRVNPIVRAVLNNTTAIDGGDQSSYIRHNAGRVGGIVWHNKIYLNTNDSIRFDTYVNFGGVIDYTSIMPSADFDLSDFMFIATFLGPLDEYDKTPA
tara:strand:+ start:544 stop:3660 length:3117 start_codon:yes stop_codon:yes gene_type:complete